MNRRAGRCRARKEGRNRRAGRCRARKEGRNRRAGSCRDGTGGLTGVEQYR